MSCASASPDAEVLSSGDTIEWVKIMETKEFDIIFRGDIVLGHQLQDVKQRLQQLFKVDATKVDALFTGRPVPLKRGLDEATANKYRDVLLKAGAQVEVCPAGSVKTAPREAPSSAPVPAPARPAGWSLAPVGAYLLTPTERPRISPVFVDTGAMSLRPAGGNLLDASEVTKIEPAQVTTPDFDVAEVGADLVRAEEKMDLPLVEVDVEDWGLADIGADLIAPEERPVAPGGPVAVGDFGLAPVGSDLGQIKPQVKPVTPDISKLRLAE